MKKILYILLIVTLAASVYGCSKGENDAMKASEDGVVEEQEEMVYPTYWVYSGDLSFEDIEVGKNIVFEVAYLMYTRGENKEIDEKASERIKQLLYIPEGIEKFLEGGNRTLNQYSILNGSKTTIHSDKTYESISGNQTIVYEISVAFIADGKDETRDFEVTLLKKYDRLYVFSFDEVNEEG